MLNTIYTLHFISLTWCLPISPWLITDDCDDEQIYLYPMVTLETMV
jgi:hypothetical protein